jgi:hypothetical protein
VPLQLLALFLQEQHTPRPLLHMQHKPLAMHQVPCTACACMPCACLGPGHTSNMQPTIQPHQAPAPANPSHASSPLTAIITKHLPPPLAPSPTTPALTSCCSCPCCSCGPSCCGHPLCSCSCSCAEGAHGSCSGARHRSPWPCPCCGCGCASCSSRGGWVTWRACCRALGSRAACHTGEGRSAEGG